MSRGQSLFAAIVLPRGASAIFPHTFCAHDDEPAAAGHYCAVAQQGVFMLGTRRR